MSKMSGRRTKVTVWLVLGVYRVTIEGRFKKWLFHKLFYVEVKDDEEWL